MLRENSLSIDKYACKRFLLAFLALLFLNHALFYCLRFIEIKSLTTQGTLSDFSLRHLAVYFALIWTIVSFQVRGLFRATSTLGWQRWRCALFPFVLALGLSLALSGFEELMTVTGSAHWSISTHVICSSRTEENALSSFSVPPRVTKIELRLSEESPSCQSVKSHFDEIPHSPQIDRTHSWPLSLMARFHKGTVSELSDIEQDRFSLNETSGSQNLWVFQASSRLMMIVLSFLSITSLSNPYLVAAFLSIFALLSESIMNAVQ